MITYEQFSSFITRVSDGINALEVPASLVNIHGMTDAQKLQHLAGLYLVHLTGYYHAILRGGEGHTIGYEHISAAVGVLRYAKDAMHEQCQAEVSTDFNLSIYPVEEADDVVRSLFSAELDNYAHMNPIQFIGRNALAPESIENNYTCTEFSAWLDEQLYALACFSLAHDIDIEYIIRQIGN